MRKTAAQLRKNLAEGHEIAHHVWLRDDPNSLTVEQVKEEFLKGIEVFKRLGVKPVGYRSPAFDLGPNTLNLLKENVFINDTSVIGHESPYFIFLDGEETGLIELPVCWELDDAPYYLFTTKPAYRQGLADPDSVLKVCQRDFDWAYRESGFYLLTLHAQITGRGYRMDALSQSLDYIIKFPDVWINTHKEIGECFAGRVDKEKQIRMDTALGWHAPYERQVGKKQKLLV